MNENLIEAFAAHMQAHPGYYIGCYTPEKCAENATEKQAKKILAWFDKRK